MIIRTGVRFCRCRDTPRRTGGAGKRHRAGRHVQMSLRLACRVWLRLSDTVRIAVSPALGSPVHVTRLWPRGVRPGRCRQPWLLRARVRRVSRVESLWRQGNTYFTGFTDYSKIRLSFRLPFFGHGGDARRGATPRRTRRDRRETGRGSGGRDSDSRVCLTHIRCGPCVVRAEQLLIDNGRRLPGGGGGRR